MGLTVADLNFVFTADTKQVDRALDSIDGKARSAATGMSSSFTGMWGRQSQEATRFGQHTRGVFSTIGKGLGLLGAYGAGRAVVGLFKDSIDEAREAQKVGAQTNAVLKSTGGIAGVTAKHVGDLATAISRKTGIDDENIKSTENLLLTFKNLRNEAGQGNAVFDRTTKIATDMGAALGQDGASSAIQLGKALNDPVKGLTALTRVGVTFDEQQQKQIKTLTESGHRLEAQKIILRELTSEFGGSAAAQATWADKAKVLFGNLEEQVGTALLPMLDDLNKWFVKDGSDAIQHWVNWFRRDGVDGIIRDFASEVTDFGRDALPALKDGLAQTRDVAGDLLPIARDVLRVFDALPDDAQKMIALGGGIAYTKRQLGLLGVPLPGVNRGVSTLATNTGLAATNAGNAGSKFAGLRTALGTAGTWAGIAAGVKSVMTNVHDLQLIFGDAPDVSGTSLPKVLADLQKTDLGQHAAELGIDLDRLAKSLHNSGGEGEYVQQVLADLKDKAGGDFLGLGGWKTGADRMLGPLQSALGFVGADIHLTGEEAWAAKKALDGYIDALNGAKAAAASKPKGGSDWFVNLAGSLTGQTALVDKYGDALAGLPRQAVTQIFTPGAVKSTGDVERLAKKLDLTPSDVRTVMKVLDFATPDIKRVTGEMEDAAKPRTGKIDADTTDATRKARDLAGLLGDTTRTRTARVEANTQPAWYSINQILGGLQRIDGYVATSYVNVVRRNPTGGVTSSYGGHSAPDAAAPRMIPRFAPRMALPALPAPRVPAPHAAPSASSPTVVQVVAPRQQAFPNRFVLEVEGKEFNAHIRDLAAGEAVKELDFEDTRPSRPRHGL